ncbi:cupin domain-containing protein [Streptomyces sp. 3211]|uniref:cupin domain-containing protein n=1 Tax=Streptomyces sp. 3211 TaxID=1964449 RepID=UPI001F447609|nr:cupin domain-containing protein [Streptomyces sp. 3211]
MAGKGVFRSPQGQAEDEVTFGSASCTLNQPLWVMDTLAVVRADATVTGGALGLTEVRAPKGSGSTLHTHTLEDEAFLVIEGRLTLWHGKHLESKTAHAGELYFLPRNQPHAFEVQSREAYFYTISTPAGFEEFYRLLGYEASKKTLPPSMQKRADKERVLQVLEGLGITVHGPRPDQPTPSIPLSF